MEMPLQGSLRQYSLPAILITLSERKATGTLVVSSAGLTKNVYFRDGNVISASSSVEEDRLGDKLVRAGKITAQEYERSVDVMKTTGKRVGSVLIDLGFITPKDLYWGVKHQVQEIIFSLFHLEEGQYVFLDSTLPGDEAITLRISIESLIYEGMKKVWNWARIKDEMPALNTVFRLGDRFKDLTAGEIRTVDLSAEERRILSLIDGKRTIEQVGGESQSNSFEVMKTLFILWSMGVVVKQATGADANGEDSFCDLADADHSGEAVIDRQPSGVSPDVVKRVSDFYERLNTLKPDEILEVDEDTATTEIRRRYYQLAREFHPDKVHHTNDKELRRKMTVIFDTVTKAYKLLQDEAKRRDYFDSAPKKQKTVAGGGAGSPEPYSQDTRETLIKEQMKRGIEEFKKGDFWGAVELFRWVTKEDPKRPAAWSYLSLALSKVPKREKEAEEALLKAHKLEPLNTEHLINLGLIYLKAGLKMRAKTQFEKALRLDPGNTRAKTELEQIE